MKTIQRGDRFGKLTIIRFVEQRHGQNVYEAFCECGKTSRPTHSNLVAGRSQSCGCRAVKHGHSNRTLTYSSWQAMLSRCSNPNARDYERYGKAGISVCQEWNDFRVFLEEMGERPSRSHTIDRLNGSLGYFNANCRWATKRQQSENTRTNRWIEFRGERCTITEWARRIGVTDSALNQRLKKWPLEKCLTEPYMALAVRRWGAR